MPGCHLRAERFQNQNSATEVQGVAPWWRARIGGESRTCQSRFAHLSFSSAARNPRWKDRSEIASPPNITGGWLALLEVVAKITSSQESITKQHAECLEGFLVESNNHTVARLSKTKLGSFHTLLKLVILFLRVMLRAVAWSST